MNLVEVELPNDRIAVIRLQRQSRRNALSVALVRELLDALQAPGADRRVRVSILTGEGAAFCAGGDLTDESTLEAARDGIVGSVDLQQLFSTMPLRLRSIEQPVIAAINGPAAGAGLALALAADLRVAGASATLHVASIKIGLSGGECGLSWHLPRLVGTGRALELLLTGRPVAAEEAERLGLVNRVVPDDELLDAAIALARDRREQPVRVACDEAGDLGRRGPAARCGATPREQSASSRVDDRGRRRGHVRVSREATAAVNQPVALTT
jgi:enoyl-CoA hydratase